MMRKKYMRLVAFAGQRAAELERLGRHMSAVHYVLAATKFARDVADKPLNRISAVDLSNWVDMMRNQGLTRNTIDYYFRTLRAVYNRAVFEGEADGRLRPFEGIHTKPEPTKKRALSLAQLQALCGLELKNRSDERARDVFMLSFYLRGIAPVDLYGLKRDNVRGGVLTYRRSKTRQQLMMRVEPEAAALMEVFGSDGGDMLLSLPSRDSVNVRLRKLGFAIGLPFALTLYCARHTWATVAQRANAPIGVISQGLGHGNEVTTRIYLAGIETGAVDDWNRRIIGCLKNIHYTLTGNEIEIEI